MRENNAVYRRQETAMLFEVAVVFCVLKGIILSRKRISEGSDHMARTVGIGHQDFEQLIANGYFYIDKAHFIKEWWEAADDVTQITRPRRFGKTLNMSMLEKFFSIKYAGRGELFEGLSVWEEKKYRELQGTYPVISLSFANMKGADYEGTRYSINQILEELYNKNIFLLDGDFLSENEKAYFQSVKNDMKDATAAWAIHKGDTLNLYGD